MKLCEDVKKKVHELSICEAFRIGVRRGRPRDSAEAEVPSEVESQLQANRSQDLNDNGVDRDPDVDRPGFTSAELSGPQEGCVSEAGQCRKVKVEESGINGSEAEGKAGSGQDKEP